MSLLIGFANTSIKDQALVLENIEEGASLIDSKEGLNSAECIQRIKGILVGVFYACCKCTPVYTCTPRRSKADSSAGAADHIYRKTKDFPDRLPVQSSRT